MKQLPLFNKRPTLDEVYPIEGKFKTLPVYPHEILECDLAHMSECEGEIFRFAISDRFRCARHISLQRIWSGGHPTLDLIDWIEAVGDELLPRGKFLVSPYHWTKIDVNKQT